VHKITVNYGDIVIRKTLNLAYFLIFKLTQTCSSLGGPLQKHYTSFVCTYVLSVVKGEWKTVKILLQI